MDITESRKSEGLTFNMAMVSSTRGGGVIELDPRQKWVLFPFLTLPGWSKLLKGAGQSTTVEQWKSSPVTDSGFCYCEGETIYTIRNFGSRKSTIQFSIENSLFKHTSEFNASF